MTVKELKEKLKNLPDDAQIVIDYSYWLEGQNWDEEETSAIKGIYVLDGKSIGTENAVHLSTYRQELPECYKTIYEK